MARALAGDPLHNYFCLKGFDEPNHYCHRFCGKLGGQQGPAGSKDESVLV